MPVGLADLDAGIEQRLRCGAMTITRGPHKRSHAVVAGLLDSGAGIEQRLQGFSMTILCGI